MTGLTFQRPPYTQLNGPEIQHFIENDLRYAVARLVELPRPDPLQVSPWVGDERVAEGYPTRPVQRCASLLRDAHNRLWRRIGCVAAEGIGLDNLDAVGVATAALAGKQLRSKMSWDWAVACAVILQLSRALKCQAADDLLMVCELHPAYAKQHLPVAELTSIVCGVHVQLIAHILFKPVETGATGGRCRLLDRWERSRLDANPHSFSRIRRSRRRKSPFRNAPIRALARVLIWYPLGPVRIVAYVGLRHGSSFRVSRGYTTSRVA